MNFFRALTRPVTRRTVRRRTTLLELHRRGVVQVFRRPSFFRLWEPLREHPCTEEFSG